MAVIKLTKIEAAQRQVDAGIRMLFAEEDPVAIHTVAMAAFGILRNLADRDNGNYMAESMRKSIRPGMDKNFWSAVNSFANYLKHADRDPNSNYEGVSDEVNDSLLVIASEYYKSLGYTMTHEMSALTMWALACDPLGINDKCPPLFQSRIDDLAATMEGMTRSERLSYASTLLAKLKNQDT